MASSGRVPNVCAGPFGAFYDFYIERPRLMAVIGRAIWGIDASVLYASMGAIEGAAEGATIVDVPCGGGVALRALSPAQEVRYIAADLGQADLFLSYSGLHMVADPERAIGEIARCLKPGGRLVGTTFLSDGPRRARAAFKIGSYRGHPVPPSREDVRRWLEAAGFAEPAVGPQPGFAVFSGRRR